MPRVEVQVTIAPLSIAPGHSIDVRDPDKGHCAGQYKALIPASPGDRLADLWREVYLSQTVVKGQVAVEPRLQSLDAVHQQVALKRVARAGRGHGPKGGILALYPLDPLRAPE